MGKLRDLLDAAVEMRESECVDHHDADGLAANLYSNASKMLKELKRPKKVLKSKKLRRQIQNLIVGEFELTDDDPSARELSKDIIVLIKNKIWPPKQVAATEATGASAPPSAARVTGCCAIGPMIIATTKTTKL